MPADARVVLHVGVFKTGTSALQETVFGRCEGVRYMGKPHTPASAHAEDLVRRITDLDSLDWDADVEACRQCATSLLRTPERCVLISEEELSVGSLHGRADRKVIAQRLRELFPEATVLLVIRNQLTALASLYGYAMKMPGMRHVPCDAWLDDLRDSLPYGRGLQAFRYADLIGLYVGLFGIERVEILFHEDLRERRAEFLTRLAQILGVEAASLVELPAKEVNVRPSRRRARMARFTASHPRTAGRLATMPTTVGRRIEARLDGGPALHVAWSAADEEFIRSYYAVGNRLLRDAYGLDVGRLGYPL